MQFYPFLISERDKLKSLNLKLDQLPQDLVYSSAVQNAAFDLLGTAKQPADADFAVVELVLAKIYLSIIGDPTVNEKYAERKSLEFRDALEKENLTFLIKIAREDFGMRLKTEESLRVHFVDFLAYKPEFLKLSQMDLMGGYVQLTKTQLAWVLKGAIKKWILETIPKNKGFPESMIKAANSVKGKVAVARPAIARPRISSLREDALPPCIRDIIKALEAGKANHNAHFVLVTFLHGLSLDEKSMLDIFRRSPKFKENITAYQIRFAKGRGYTCPACDSVKGYGLCTGNCPRKHPVSNYLLNIGWRGPRPGQPEGGKNEKKDKHNNG